MRSAIGFVMKPRSSSRPRNVSGPTGLMEMMMTEHEVRAYAYGIITGGGAGALLTMMILGAWAWAIGFAICLALNLAFDAWRLPRRLPGRS
jgi:hypothetical protein